MSIDDQWLDEQVRAAYEQVSLPERSLQRLKKQAQRRDPPSRLWIAVVLLAATLAVAVVAAWPEPGVVASPSPAVPMPMPAPVPVQDPRVVEGYWVRVSGDGHEVLIDEERVEMIGQPFRLREGEHSFRLRSRSGLGDPVVVEVRRHPDRELQEIWLSEEPPRENQRPVPVPGQSVEVMLLGNGGRGLVDGGSVHPLFQKFELPSGPHDFRLQTESGELGDTVRIDVVPQPDGAIMRIVLPSPSVAPPEPPVEPPPDVEGLWVGATSSGRSFKLTVLGQTGDNFEGTVEVQLEDGTFESLAVSGEVDSAGALTFQGGGIRFQAKASGRKLTGTLTLPGKRAEPFTAYGGR